MSLNVNLYDSIVEQGMKLKPREREAFWRAVIEYVAYQTEPSLSGTPDICFGLVRPSLDKQRARADAGSNGGQRRSYNAKQTPSKPQANGQANAKQTRSKRRANGQAKSKRIRNRRRRSNKQTQNARGRVRGNVRPDLRRLRRADAGGGRGRGPDAGLREGRRQGVRRLLRRPGLDEGERPARHGLAQAAHQLAQPQGGVRGETTEEGGVCR